MGFKRSFYQMKLLLFFHIKSLALGLTLFFDKYMVTSYEISIYLVAGFPHSFLRNIFIG